MEKIKAIKSLKEIDRVICLSYYKLTEDKVKEVVFLEHAVVNIEYCINSIKSDNLAEARVYYSLFLFNILKFSEVDTSILTFVKSIIF